MAMSYIIYPLDHYKHLSLALLILPYISDDSRGLLGFLKNAMYREGVQNLDSIIFLITIKLPICSTNDQ